MKPVRCSTGRASWLILREGGPCSGPTPGVLKIWPRRLQQRCGALKIGSWRIVEARGCCRGCVPGAQLTKTRPAVVLSTEVYHKHRPDVVVGLITTQVPNPLTPTDCALTDWKQAGLHAASYFRLFPVTLLQHEVRLIGRLSGSDRAAVRACLKAGLGGE